MKKFVFAALILTVALCACNRKDFVNKLCGTWKLNKYELANQNLTASYDTTHYKYQLVINNDGAYGTSWLNYKFQADSIILNIDSVYDSTGMVWNFKKDTIRFIDTTITPYAGSGKWYLLNSEEDFEEIDNADTSSAQIFRILTLDKGNLHLLNGNQEYDFTK